MNKKNMKVDFFILINSDLLIIFPYQSCWITYIGTESC